MLPDRRYRELDCRSRYTSGDLEGGATHLSAASIEQSKSYQQRYKDGPAKTYSVREEEEHAAQRAAHGGVPCDRPASAAPVLRLTAWPAPGSVDSILS